MMKTPSAIRPRRVRQLLPLVGSLVLAVAGCQEPRAATMDPGMLPDASFDVDLGEAIDLVDAAAALVDRGEIDMGLVDMGLVDAGLVDTGLVDAGLVDATLDATTDAALDPADASSPWVELVFADVTYRRPAMVLAVDGSSAMNEPFDERTRGEALRDAVEGLVARDLDIDLGLVVFSDDVVTTVAARPDNGMDVLAGLLAVGPGGGRDYAAAVNASAEILRRVPRSGRYMIFIAGGPPTAGDAPAAAVAAQGDGITIFTLSLAGGAPTEQALAEVGGQGDGNAAPFLFAASTRDDLDVVFGGLVVASRCSVGPVDWPTRDVQVAVRLPDGSEQPVSPELVDLDPAAELLFLPGPICQTLRREQASVVVRYRPLP